MEWRILLKNGIGLVFSFQIKQRDEQHAPCMKTIMHISFENPEGMTNFILKKIYKLRR